MSTECNQFIFGFHPQKRREVRAQFDGGAISSDGGGLLLREVEKRVRILRQFAACFTDYRNPDLIEHTVEELVAQRVYGLALGYEDPNDHEELRNDPLLAVLVEKADPCNQVLAGKSTLNRLELTKETASRKERYKKIVLDHGAVDRVDFTAGYTYGHGLDNGSLSRFGGLPQDSTNPAAEYGNSDYDTRHRFTFEASYALPGKKGFGQLLEGWKVNGILTVATGQPWLVDDSSDNFSNTSEGTDRWDFFGNPHDFLSSAASIPHCGVNPTLPSGTPFALGNIVCTEQSGVSGLVTTLDPSLGAKCLTVAPDPTTLATGGCYVKGNSAMVPPTFGTFGTMGRNLFYDPGFKNLDFSVFKDFKFHERFGAEFRVEFFNVLNHPNLANPYGGVVGSNIGDDPSVSHSFGCGCGTPDIINGNPVLGSGGARVMQLGLKLSF
jgi:DDE family transposase